MRHYELMVILDPDLEERTVAPSLDKFLNVIRNDGGTIDKVDVWGRRRMAYHINKQREGQYVLMHLNMAPAATLVLERNIRFQETVMRSMITVVE